MIKEICKNIKFEEVEEFKVTFEEDGEFKTKFFDDLMIIDKVTDSKRYEGDYTVIPKAYEEQVLETKDRFLNENITVAKVPFYETSNNVNGKTIYIASEV